MGKRYYCNYCDRSFTDNAGNRKKHLKGIQHQRLVKLHYDNFRDPELILQEELGKKPCLKFQQTGQCSFGTGCKYSHYTPDDIQNLQEQVRQHRDEKNKSTLQEKEVDLASWLEKRSKRVKMEKSAGSSSDDRSNTLLELFCGSIPASIATRHDLPKSLIPAKPIDLLMAEPAEWGL